MPKENRKPRRKIITHTSAPGADINSTRVQLFNEDCLVALKKLADNSVDSLVTDPPAGISFMSKGWDDDKGGSKQWIQWMESVMRECLRVLKPGGHGLVWALPRTSHWTAMALEWSGFEVRDVVTHLFGSGFPKSLDVSKAIDGALGAERKKGELKFKGGSQLGVINDDSWEPKDVYESFATTDAAKQWQGWGTALKPAVERWVLVRKPIVTMELIVLIKEQLIKLETDLCSRSAQNVKNSSRPTRAGSEKEKASIARADAPIHTEDAKAKRTEIGRAEGSSAQMDTSLLTSEEAISTSLSIVSSWKDTLEESSEVMSKCITGMSERLITDFQTLNYSLSEITHESIIQAVSNPSGRLSHVHAVNQSFDALKAGLSAIRMHSALASAGASAGLASSSVNELLAIGDGGLPGPLSEDIVLIRKPLSEKKVAANVLKWGCGALNIDASRVAANDAPAVPVFSKGAGSRHVGIMNGGKLSPAEPRVTSASQQGRFPANLVFSHTPYCTDDQCDIECAVKMLDAQSGTSGGDKRTKKNHVGPAGNAVTHGTMAAAPDGSPCYRDLGGASRFFYVAKISKAERNAGLDCAELVWEKDAWESADLISSMENISQLLRAMSASTMRYLENKSWSTDLYGHAISEQYPQGFKSIIETALRLITELKISNCSQPLSTRESIQDAIKTIEATGLSLAEGVAYTSQLNLDSINEATASLLLVVFALLPELLRIRSAAKSGNFHSTVKPRKLMAYLIRLISPPGGVVLDPFMGSGSTGCAAIADGFEFVGIERETEYFKIAQARINACRSRTP